MPQPVLLPLTPAQTHALFDILTHHETYAEIEAFKSPDGVITHGYPFRREPRRDREAARSSSGGGGGRFGSFASGFWGGRDSVVVVVSDDDHDSGDSDDKDDENQLSEMPVLQLLTSTFVMRLPALKTLSRDFWAGGFQGLLSRFADAHLSESYDKGAMGVRKTLASGAGSVLEMLARGFLGGVVKSKTTTTTTTTPLSDPAALLKKKKYDMMDGRELERAWQDVLDGLVYSDLVDDLFRHAAETDDLETHSPAVEAAARYILVHLAALMHHVFVRTSSGRHLIELLDGVHRLVPYRVIRQTLRIGNAATMINGMVRLILAKLSFASLTNWARLTQRDDDGMNLLQNIITMVLTWDASQFNKTADRIEKMAAESGQGDGGDDTNDSDHDNDEAAKEATVTVPSKKMLEAIRAHVQGGMAAQEAVRRASLAEHESVVLAIFRARDPELAEQVSEEQHAVCLEYYAALLSMRDREAITSVLCRQPPDLLTRTLKEALAAYTPLIRAVHERVDLGDHMQDMQGFIAEFLRVSTPPGGGKDNDNDIDKNQGQGQGQVRVGVRVEDYVALFHNHKKLFYKFLHAVASQCPEVWDAWRAWTNASVEQFRERAHQSTTVRPEETEGTNGTNGTTSMGSMKQSLQGLVSGLDESSRADVLLAVDAHAGYLALLKEVSDAKLTKLASYMENQYGGGGGGGDVDEQQAATTTTTTTTAAVAADTVVDENDGWGPGIYLARWQDILDDTLITPLSTRRPAMVRRGRDVRRNMLTMTTTTTTTLGDTEDDDDDGGGKEPGSGGKKKVVGEDHAPPDVSIVMEKLGQPFHALMQVVNMERRVFGDVGKS